MRTDNNKPKDESTKEAKPADAEVDKAAPPPIDPSKTHEVARFSHDKPLTTCRVDPTGRYAFAGAEDLMVYRWDLRSGKKTTLTGHESWVRSMDFSPDGERLYTAGWDGQVRWWATAADQPKSDRAIQAHRGFARWVQSSPCGQMIATCGNDKIVRIWEADSGRKIVELAGHRRHPYAVAFHPKDGHLASQDLMGDVRIWDPRSATQAGSVDASVMTGYDNKFAADMGGARDMQFSLDGAILASAGITNVVNSFAGQQDPIIVLIDWATRKITHHLKQAQKATGVAWGVRFHPNGFITGAIARQNGKGEVSFWRLEKAAKKPDEKTPDSSASAKGKPSQPIAVEPFHSMAIDKSVRGLDFTPDHRRFAAAHSDGTLRVYEMAEKPPEPAKKASDDKAPGNKK